MTPGIAALSLGVAVQVKDFNLALPDGLAMDGFEVLEWIRKQSGCKCLIVVVLTSSEQIKDVNQAYALGANSFLVKPLDFENTTALVQMIHQYWLQWNRLPESVREPKKNGTEINRTKD